MLICKTKNLHFGKFIAKYMTKLEEIAFDVLENNCRRSKMKIWAKTVRTFHFRAHDVNKSLRHIVVPYNICDFEKKSRRLGRDNNRHRTR